MVKYSDILSSNSSFFSTASNSNLTAVFVGATNGIGLGALQAFVHHTSGASPTIYIVGRSQKSLEFLISSLAATNSRAKYIPILAKDLTLIRDAQSAANAIAQSAEKIDILIMSPGYINMYYEPSHEGLDRVQAIRYYSRMQILLTVAPLLQKSSSPRVVTVLGAGKEGQLWADDLYLKDHYSLPNAAGASASMMTLFLEEFQKQPGNAKISFVHLYPGLVGGTGLTIKGLPGWAQVLVDWIATPLMRWFGYSVEEAGERVLYAATSPMFPAKDRQGREEAERGSDGGKGSGVYLAQGDSTVVPGNKVLSGLREDEMGTKVWDHTNKIFSSVQRS